MLNELMKLSDLMAFCEELEEDLPSLSEFKSERIRRRGVEKTIELIADTIVDTALLIVSGKGLHKPADSREAITNLEKENILSRRLAEKIRDLISFRNLLVHRYGKVDEDLEYENICEGKDDVLQFVKEIKGYLEKG